MIDLINVFAGSDVSDPDSISKILSEFSFVSGEQQSAALIQLRTDLGFNHEQMCNLMCLTRGRWMAFYRGESLFKQSHIRLLLLSLLARKVNPDLFTGIATKEGTTKTVRFKKKN